MTSAKYMKIGLKAVAVSLILLAFPWLATAATDDSYPRLANYYLTGWMSEQEAQELSKWDLVILGFEIPINSPTAYSLLKQRNPHIKLLSYIDSISRYASPPGYPASHPLRRQYEGSRDEWLLENAEGNHLNVWPGAELMNPSEYVPLVNGKRWNDYIPEFIVAIHREQRGWDGIFFDNALPAIAWFNNGRIDINNDGQNDSGSFIDNAWSDGLRALYANARALVGSNYIIITNSSHEYAESLNGRMFETVLGDERNWDEQIAAIHEAFIKSNYKPHMVVVNANTANTGNWKNWRRFRFAFTSTLLTDAYFSYDYGDKWHNQLWWYDEYDVDLGNAINNAYALFDSNGAALGVWRRDFEKGITLVNTTNAARTVPLGQTFKKINGTQDKTVNNGKAVTQVILNPYDGIVLQKIDQIATQELNISQGFVAGANAALYDIKTGVSVGNRVLTLPSMPKGTFGLTDDLDRDGIDETMTWKNGALSQYRNGQRVWIMYPYDNRWRGAVSLASGDLDGDGMREIVLAAGPGGGPHVRIVGCNGKLFNAGFFAGDKRSRGGAYIAAYDMDGDGTDEIIAGSGRGEEPWVRVFDAKGTSLNSFLAYERNNQQGVSVAVSDVNNDNASEILTVTANRVKVYASTGILLGQFVLANMGENDKRVFILQDALQKWLAVY